MNAPPPFPSSNTPSQRPKGMSGCAIAAIVGAVLGLFGIIAIAILAAIALPAYQNYVMKSQTTSARANVAQWQPAIDEYRAQHGTCPDNAALQLAADERLTLGGEGNRTASVRLQTTDAGRCAIVLQFHGMPAAVDGSTLIFESDDGQWSCTGGTMPAQLRPNGCAPGGAATP